jgi:NTP pyrophosphatase (non-canonical NTP hydrolase)
LVENQDSVFSWARETFPGADPNSPRLALRCLEEMVELCVAAGASGNDIYAVTSRAQEAARDKTGQRYLERRPDPAQVPAEAADVLITLYVLAGYRGFHLDSAVDDKMKTNRSRRWKANGDGTGYHIKED